MQIKVLGIFFIAVLQTTTTDVFKLQPSLYLLYHDKTT